MATEPTREWSDEQLKSDDLPKKDLIKFIQDNAAHSVCVSRYSACFSYIYKPAELPKNALWIAKAKSALASCSDIMLPCCC